MTPGIHTLEWCRSRSAEMARLLEELVAIESPSTDPSGVAALARRIDRELSAVGLPAKLLPVAGGEPILRARAAGSRASGSVFLLGHLDTVWDVGTLRQRPIRSENGRLYGPGSFDMKGGIVVLLYALKALEASGAALPVTVFLTPLEEVGWGTPRRHGIGDADVLGRSRLRARVAGRRRQDAAQGLDHGDSAGPGRLGARRSRLRPRRQRDPRSSRRGSWTPRR